MASSRTPTPADPLAAIRVRVAETLEAAAIGAGQRLLIGFSGGLDSTVLLHALAPLRGRFSFQLLAHHVHHGRSAQADAWAAHCAAVCASLEVPLEVARVQVAPQAGEGWEAAARRLRHAAWQGCNAHWWVSAHHRDDQAETVLFRLLRGAGVDGAAGMAPVAPGRGGPGRLRPLLGLARRELLAAAQAAGLRWVEDESNADPVFTRNFLRHQVLPVIETRFPGANAALARSAGHFAEAADLLGELADIDGQACGERPMSRPAFAQLSRSRQANLLRHRLGAMGRSMPDAARLDEALRQLAQASADHPLSLPLGDAELHAYRARLWLTPPLPALPTDPCPWRGAPLAWGEGLVECREGVGAGLEAAWLAGRALTVRCAWPGARMRLPGRPDKPFGQLAQEADLAPAERQRVPVLCVDGVPAWIAGIGVAEGFVCPPDRPGWVLRWVRPRDYCGSAEALL